MLLCFGLGVAVAVLGSLIPALAAARAAPASALRAGDEERAFTRLRRSWPGLAAIAVGTIASFLPPVAGLPLFGYVAIALLLLGSLTLLPRIAPLLLAIVPAPRASARSPCHNCAAGPGAVSLTMQRWSRWRSWSPPSATRSMAGSSASCPRMPT
jgi:putative ABC transport system permease protein